MSNRPEQRRVPARVHTGSGWLAGTIHLPKMQGFLAHLCSGELYLALTDVLLPGQKSTIPFFALRRASAVLVVPACAEWVVGVGPPDLARTDRMVCCLLDIGAVTGRLEMTRAVRVSDFVADRDGFLVLRHAVIGPAHEATPLIFVNARACVGVGDLGPGAAHPGGPDESVDVELDLAPTGPGLPA